MLVFFKWYNLISSLDRMGMIIRESKYGKWLPLIEVLFKIIFISHFVSLGWHLLAIYEIEVKGYKNSWL